MLISLDSDPSQLPANFRIRVRGGLTRLEGRLEVSAGDDDYGLVCDIGWTIREASVACRMLGFRYGRRSFQNFTEVV